MDVKDIVGPIAGPAQSVVQAIMAYWRRDKAIELTRERIRSAIDANPAELAIAAQYSRDHTTAYGLRVAPAPMTPAQQVACEHLFDIFEYNGGSELFGHETKRWLSTPAHLTGGITAETVAVVAKGLQSPDGNVPPTTAVGGVWRGLNQTVGIAALLVALAVPEVAVPALFALGAGNVTAADIFRQVEQWNSKIRGSEEGRREFLYMMGKYAERKKALEPEAYMEEAVQRALLEHAEAAARAVSRGPGKHTSEQVRVLCRFEAVARHTIGEAHHPSEDVTDRYQTLLQFIAEGKIRENQALLTIDNVKKPEYRDRMIIPGKNKEAYRLASEAYQAMAQSMETRWADNSTRGQDTGPHR